MVLITVLQSSLMSTYCCNLCVDTAVLNNIFMASPEHCKHFGNIYPNRSWCKEYKKVSSSLLSCTLKTILNTRADLSCSWETSSSACFSKEVTYAQCPAQPSKNLLWSHPLKSEVNMNKTQWVCWSQLLSFSLYTVYVVVQQVTKWLPFHRSKHPFRE